MANIIFDYDGTLHDSMRIYAPAVRAVHKNLVEAGLVKDREVPDDELKKYLGLTAREMWAQFAPELPEDQKAAGSRMIGQELFRRVENNEARLYDGVPEMLTELKNAGHRLIYLSNCGEPYMKLHAQAFHLNDYFDEMHCAGQFGGASKPEIAAELMKSWTGAVIAVGDRYKDMELSQVDGIRTVFCAYGFGDPSEGQTADAAAYSVSEIPACINSLLA